MHAFVPIVTVDVNRPFQVPALTPLQGWTVMRKYKVNKPIFLSRCLCEVFYHSHTRGKGRERPQHRRICPGRAGVLYLLANVLVAVSM